MLLIIYKNIEIMEQYGRERRTHAEKSTKDASEQ